MTTNATSSPATDQNGSKLKSIFNFAAKTGVTALATASLGMGGALVAGAAFALYDFYKDYKDSYATSLWDYTKNNKWSLTKSLLKSSAMTFIGFGIGDWVSGGDNLSSIFSDGASAEAAPATATATPAQSIHIDSVISSTTPPATTVSMPALNGSYLSIPADQFSYDVSKHINAEGFHEPNAAAKAAPLINLDAVTSTLATTPANASTVSADALKKKTDLSLSDVTASADQIAAAADTQNAITAAADNAKDIAAASGDGEITLQDYDDAAASTANIAIPDDAYKGLEALSQNGTLSPQAQAMADAAMNGQTWALRDVGLGLINGQYGFDQLGAAFTPETADKWGAQLLQEAAASGDLKAQTDLAYYQYNGLSDIIAQNQDKALETITQNNQVWSGGESLLPNQQESVEVKSLSQHFPEASNDNVEIGTIDRPQPLPEETILIQNDYIGSPTHQAREAFAASLPEGEHINDYRMGIGEHGGFTFEKIERLSPEQIAAFEASGIDVSGCDIKTAPDGKGHVIENCQRPSNLAYAMPN